MSKEKLEAINTEGQITFAIEQKAIEKDIESALMVRRDMFLAPLTSRMVCPELDWRKIWKLMLTS